MKTIAEISKEFVIPKSTLKARVERAGITYVKRFGLNYIKSEDIASITHENKRQPYLVVKKIKPMLVYAFKELNPCMSNEEISTILCIPKFKVDEILNKQFLIIESKLNFK